MTNVLKLLEDCGSEFGDAFALKMGPRYVAVFSSPDANKDILLTKADSLSAVDSFGPLSWMLGQGLARLDGVSHSAMKKLLMPAFHREVIQAHAHYMNKESLERLASWQKEAWVDGVSAARELTLSIILHTFFGSQLTQPKQLSHDLSLLFDCLLIEPEKPTSFFRFVTMLKLPWPNLRSRLDHFLFTIIEEKTDAHFSTLSLLKNARDDNGNPLSKEALRDQLLTFIVAGHDTTAMALAWSWYELAQHPVVLKTLKEELSSVKTSDLEQLRRLPYLNAVLKEVLRLHPPIAIGIRRAIAPLNITDYAIPKGANVVYAPYLTHRNESLWKDALSFKPERFLGYNPPRYQYLAFGAGQHSCIGVNLAQLELQVILASLVKHASWELCSEVSAKLSPTLEPGQLKLRFKPS
jgi:cytochrome P450